MSTLALLEGVLPPDPREPVASLPFEVSHGCTRIEVRYEHQAGHILDLGLLDPHATPFPSEGGFRGWSGSARQRIFVAQREATPGYLAGALPAGRWQVLLGRAKVEASGCRYRVEVRCEYGKFESELPPYRPAVAPHIVIPDDAPWLPGDLQSHTEHSDAQGSIAELLAAGAARGLSFLAVTDHNTVSPHRPLADFAAGPVLPIPGMELTTYHGHANIWGATGWVDFRVRDAADLDWVVARVHALGGLMSINHPKRQPGCIGCDWSYPVPAGIDAFEVWQGPWWLRNWESLARYDELLRAGRRLSLVGGSDRHQPAGIEHDHEMFRVGSPTTFLQLPERSLAAVLAALKCGRTAVSEGPTGPQVTLARDPERWGEGLVRVAGGTGERLRFIGDRGVLDEEVLDGRGIFRYRLPSEGHFLRCEVVAEGSLDARHTALAASLHHHPLPYGITEAEVAAHPWRLALSGPLYLNAPAHVGDSL
jgi:predicted metal-dependent phosphoesterase TrpH